MYDSLYKFDYEFSFDNNDIKDTVKFDEIYNQCKIIDDSGERRSLVYNKCIEILNLFNIAPGFRTFSTFITFNNNKYKITIYNINWNGSGKF